jgi:MobA-like NTP transferase domain
VIFVFPMAGESRRFSEAGYLQPKFRLPVHGAPLFDHAVASFRAYFHTDLFLFITRGRDNEDFVTERCEALGVKNFILSPLEAPTAGQAESVFLGLRKAGIADHTAIIVFNIDTFRPGYRQPAVVADPAYAGYLEVFRGSGDGWSFVVADPHLPNQVSSVAEKLAVSDLCCTGLYYFRRAGDFRWAFVNPPLPRSAAETRERFVAPLYNALIARGDRIGIQRIDPGEAIFCGTPEQYDAVIASQEAGRRLRI